MTAQNPDHRNLALLKRQAHLGKSRPDGGTRSSPLTQQALAFYDAELRAHLEPAHDGKYIVIDPASRDYEVDASPVAASVHMNDRRPGAPTIAFFIGHDRPRAPTLPPDFPTADDIAAANALEATLLLESEAYHARCRRTAKELEAYYNAKLRPRLEPTHNGHFLFIDAKSRDYEVDADFFAGSVHLEDRQPKAEMYCFHIGHNAQTSVFHGQRIASHQ